MVKSISQNTLSKERVSTQKLPFILLGILCIFGSWSVLPYTVHLLGGALVIPFGQLFLITTAQSIVLYGVVCWLSYKLLPKTDLAPFSIQSPVKRILVPGLVSGVAVGFLLFALNITLFKNSLLNSVAHLPAWAGILASFYGGINEEVLLRLFFFTAVYFLLHKVFRITFQKRTSILWMANLIVAVAFGAGHLPAALKLVGPSGFEILRVLLLNGIAGVVFGWLYWTRGIWTAMVAHFAADLVIHVFLA